MENAPHESAEDVRRRHVHMVPPPEESDLDSRESLEDAVKRQLILHGIADADEP